jgi:sugar-specific transcriptional regulator TrmB
MEKDLIKRLELFGLTSNQAKTYLTIVQHQSVTVSQIAKFTKFHRPDIYTMLPKLEKKGLVTKTLGSPVVVQAVPIKKALLNLASVEKKRASDRIAKMNFSINELTETISSLYKVDDEPKSEEVYFSLLTEDHEIKNRADQLFEKAKNVCRIVLVPEAITRKAPRIYEHFKAALCNGAKIELLIEAPDLLEDLQSYVERVRPDSNNFFAKFLCTKKPKPFQVIDGKEVWISTTKKGETSNVFCVLWSNGTNLIEVYEERFERMWNNKNAIVVYPKIKNESKEKWLIPKPPINIRG